MAVRLQFPDWCSAVDRTLIQSALDQVCPPQLFVLGRVESTFDSPWLSEAAAVESVLTVMRVVASRLPVKVPTNRRQDLEQLLASIIVDVAARRASPKRSLADFETIVKDALNTYSWWPAVGKTTRAAAVPEEILQRRDERRRVVSPLLDDLDWTPTRWAMESGVDPSVTLDYLAGTSVPRLVHRERITDTLVNALKLKPPLHLPE